MNPILEEFKELVEIPSPTGDERKMADRLKQKLREIGCEVFEDDAGKALGGTAGNVIARLKGEGGRPVLLSAHMDRVPNGDGIICRVDGDRIVSAGDTILAADDVSGICAILDGLRRVVKSGRPHGDVEIVFTIHEERLAQGGKYLDYSRLTARNAYCFDSPGRIGRIISSAPYKVQFFADVFGKQAHAGNEPERGVNAVVYAAKCLYDIQDGRIDEETTANWAVFRAGSIEDREQVVTNVVCDHAEICGEARSRNKEKLDAYVSYVKEHFRAVLECTPAEYTLTVKECFDGFSVPPEDPTVSILAAELRAMGITPVIEGGGGGMDANRLNARGIRCVGVATGYRFNHSTREELFIDDLVRAGELAERLILAYAKL